MAKKLTTKQMADALTRLAKVAKSRSSRKPRITSARVPAMKQEVSVVTSEENWPTEGYVANCYPPTKAGITKPYIIHPAWFRGDICPDFKNARDRGRLTHPWPKVHAPSIEVLRAWALNVSGVVPNECRYCEVTER